MEKKLQLTFSLPETVTPYMLLFFFASMAGWVWEVLVYFVTHDSAASLPDLILHYRGVLQGPWAPIYGFGFLFLVIVWQIFKESKLKVILFSILSCGILEYATGLILEAVFHKRFWDYTGLFLSIGGKICFVSVFGFGVVGAVFMIFFMPRYLKLIKKQSPLVLQGMNLILTLLFAIDYIYSTIHLFIQR